MKKRIKKEPLLNILAREVGRAAGTIANATQGLSVNAATDKKREKATGMSRQRVMPKKKNSGNLPTEDLGSDLPTDPSESRPK